MIRFGVPTNNLPGGMAVVPAASQRGQPVALREATFADYSQINALSTRHGMRARDSEEWSHLWVNNPEYLRHPGWPIGWVLGTADGHIVGSVLNVPLGYEFEGRKLTAAAGRAWVVDEPYRGYAILLLDEYFGQSGVDLFLNTTVNAQAEEAYNTFDSPRVPKGHWDRSAFWVTGYRGFATSAIARKGWAFGWALRYPIAAMLWSRDILKTRRTRPCGEFEVRIEPRFNESFDEFWDELRSLKRHVLLGERTRETLAWHFRFALGRGEAWILTAFAKGRLVAYAVFDRRDKKEYGLKRVRLVDYQSLVEGREPLRALVTKMISICSGLGVDMLEDRGCALAGDIAPHRLKLPSWLYYYKASPALAEQLQDPAIWEPSSFDGDSTL